MEIMEYLTSLTNSRVSERSDLGKWAQIMQIWRQFFPGMLQIGMGGKKQPVAVEEKYKWI